MGKTPQSVLESNQRWRNKNKEKHLQRAREYHHANKDAINERRRKHRAENPNHYSVLRRARVYGITAEQYEGMVEDQDGCCAICKRGAELVVDHHHMSGRVRSLLCSPCNTALGLLQEDPGRMKAMRDYVRKDAAMMKAQAVQAKNGGGQQGGPA